MWWKLEHFEGMNQLQTEIIIAGTIVIAILSMMWIFTLIAPGYLDFVGGPLGGTEKMIGNVLAIYCISSAKLPAWTRGSKAVSSGAGLIAQASVASRGSEIVLTGRENKQIYWDVMSGKMMQRKAVDGLPDRNAETIGMICRGDKLHIVVYTDGVYKVNEAGFLQRFWTPEDGHSVLGVAELGGDFIRSTIPLNPEALRVASFGGAPTWVIDPSNFNADLELIDTSSGLSTTLKNDGGKYIAMSSPLQQLRLNDVNVTYWRGLSRVTPDQFNDPLAVAQMMHAEKLVNDDVMSLGKNIVNGALDSIDPGSFDLEFTVRSSSRLTDPGLWTNHSSIAAHQINDSSRERPIELGNAWYERGLLSGETKVSGVDNPTVRILKVSAAPISYLNDTIVNKNDLAQILRGNMRHLCVWIKRDLHGQTLMVDDQPVNILDAAMYLFVLPKNKTVMVSVGSVVNPFAVGTDVSCVYLM